MYNGYQILTLTKTWSCIKIFWTIRISNGVIATEKKSLASNS